MRACVESIDRVSGRFRGSCANGPASAGSFAAGKDGVEVED